MFIKEKKQHNTYLKTLTNITIKKIFVSRFTISILLYIELPSVFKAIKHYRFFDFYNNGLDIHSKIIFIFVLIGKLLSKIIGLKSNI